MQCQELTHLVIVTRLGGARVDLNHNLLVFHQEVFYSFVVR